MANIDSELAFLRDAQEGDGKAAREIIASALSEICTDRSYPFLKLTATEDGEYEAEEGHPYTSVEVNVQDSPLAYRCADRFKVTENKDYTAYGLFGDDNTIITEFDVQVTQVIREKKSLTITENGEYEAGEEECYNPVIVDIEDSHHEGDLLEPSFYYSTPGNPNFDANQYIFTDHGILFGTRAGEIFRRLPQLDEVIYGGKTYIHDTWNPGIDPYDGLVTDQQFNPTWNLPPNGYSRQNPKIVYFDADVFAAVAYNKAMKWFLRPGETVIINNTNTKLKYLGESYAGIERTFWEWINVDEIIDLHYASSDSLLNTRYTINDDNDYYCWKHSFVRAMMNNSNTDLVCSADMNAYSSNAVKNALGEDIYNAIHQVTHIVNYARKRDLNTPYYRCKIYKFYDDYEESDGYNYLYVNPADIPVDPDTGEQSPKYGHLYELASGGTHSYIMETTDEYIHDGKSYYMYIHEPGNPNQKGTNISNPHYANYIGKYNSSTSELPSNLNYEIGISNPEHTQRAKMAYIDNNRVYRFTLSGGSASRSTEYTLENHVNFLMQHGTWSKISFHELDTFLIDANFEEKFILKYGKRRTEPTLAAAITPYDYGLYEKRNWKNPSTGTYMDVYVKYVNGKIMVPHDRIHDDADFIWADMDDSIWATYDDQYNSQQEDGHPIYWTKYQYTGSSVVGEEVWANDPEFVNFVQVTAENFSFDPRTVRGAYDHTKGEFSYTNSRSFSILSDLSDFAITDTDWEYEAIANPPSNPYRPSQSLYAGRIFEWNETDQDYWGTVDGAVVEGKTYYADTKYRYSHVKIKRFGRMNLSSDRITLKNSGSWNYGLNKVLNEVNDIRDISLWRNYGLEQYYPGYDSDIWPFEDGLDVVNKTSNDKTTKLRYTYSEPKHFVCSGNNVYINVNGQTTNLFVDKTLYADPRNASKSDPLEYRWYEIKTGTNPRNGLYEYNIVSLAKKKDIPTENIPYSENYVLKTKEYAPGWDSMDVWDMAFALVEDPDDYLETKKAFWPHSTVTDMTLRKEDNVAGYSDGADSGSIYDKNMYYCDLNEKEAYDNTTVGTRTYHIDWYLCFGDVLMPKMDEERIEPTPKDYGYNFIKWKTLTHTETRSSTGDAWTVTYDDGAANIWEEYRHNCDVRYHTILNPIHFTTWDLDRAAEYISDLYAYSEYLRTIGQSSYPYRRKKVESHSYIENGDVFADEPYYEVISNPITVTNPFDDAEYLALDQLHDDIYVPTSLATNSFCFYDINEILTFYGEYSVYRFGNLGEEYPNGAYDLYSYRPYNDIYYHDNKGKEPIFINNEIEYDCETVTDKFLLSTDIWTEEGRLYQTFGVGFSDSETAFDTSNEYDMRLYMHDFYGLGTASPPKREKASYTEMSQHVNANAAYRYSSKDNYINGHYKERVDRYYYTLDPSEPHDHLRANETEAHQILAELDNEYDTVITQKKYELQGSFDASTGSSQIKHAYFYI